MKKLYLLFVLLDFILFSLSYADITLYELKGTHQQLTKECQNLSLIHGYTTLKSGKLSSVRSSGAYGSENIKFYCHPQIGLITSTMTPEEIKERQLQRQTDCPQDNISSFLQMLFPSPTGGLVPNTSSKDDPISQLKPETIGELLETIQISNYDPDPNQIALILLGKPTTKIHLQKIEEIEKVNKQLTNAKTNLLQCSTSSAPFETIKEMEAQVSKISLMLKQKKDKERFASQNYLAKQINTARGRRIQIFVDALIGALKETQTLGSPYFSNIVPEALLAYFIRKGNGKEDYKKLLTGMSQCRQLGENLNSELYSSQDYINWKSKISNDTLSDNQIQYLLDHPEFAVFYFASQTN